MFFEVVTKLKYCGVKLRSRNYFQEENKSRLVSLNAYCKYSLQSPVSASLLPKSIKVRTYQTIIKRLFLLVQDLVSHISRRWC
jgi:hypothetical protein